MKNLLVTLMLVTTCIVSTGTHAGGFLSDVIQAAAFPTSIKKELNREANKSVAATSAAIRIKLNSEAEANRFARKVQGIKKYSPKILGGQSVAYRQYPWQVALIRNTPPFRQFCGGSLIRDEWILTAAHCVDGGTLATDLLVLIGTDYLDKGGKRHSVQKIVVHESYTDPVFGFDVALLKLSNSSEEVTIDYVGPSDESKLAFPGVFAWVTGWGITDSGYPSIQLREVDVRRIANETCNSVQMYDGAVTDTMICAGYRIGQKDSCQGDSGGPLMASNQKGGMIQFGIVSWGEGCAEANRPGVYTRTAAVDTWITSKLKN